MAQSENLMAIDRLSSLPDDILCHILSLLPTKFAFTTTVLSKQWTQLCGSLTSLRSDDEETVRDCSHFNSFCRMVNAVMLSPREPNHPIKTFYINCRFGFCKNGSRIFSAWVEAANQRSVEEFHLSNSITLKLNPTIFTSKTLVVLKLERLVVKAENLCVDLPSLKILSLKEICFTYNKDIMKLLNGCPVLEDLHTFGREYTRFVEDNAAEGFKPLSKLHTCGTRKYFQNHPLFQNLIHIKLWLYGFIHGWNGVVELLQQCPKLQVLFIRRWNWSLPMEWKCPILALECISCHLRMRSSYETWKSKLLLAAQMIAAQMGYLCKIVKL
ncbi:F-box/RNI superfamily protein [Medicago truncatula]|uniref:F-box/RNI superfamily protein n=1 Tax=Medicago truncatula TaxID=3880 RepID=G7KA07_MEDTR|nr:F-box/RNI superfamily protein [Medicago truncatula]